MYFGINAWKIMLSIFLDYLQAYSSHVGIKSYVKLKWIF